MDHIIQAFQEVKQTFILILCLFLHQIETHVYRNN